MDETRTREQERATKKTSQDDDVFALIEARYGEGKDAGSATGPALSGGFDCGCDCSGAGGAEDAGAASDESGGANGASSCCG